ncbi:MAG: Uncharacterized protein FD189_1676 [Elusimicrobia bacterium]|nr:MAG: Uncharacterized protein FD154_1842 [Elusimicrobiota bacterium]KAF0154796.1 MAG: Uncharacterized protein FD189_1676 [Elusimicrobiota bacterium]
MDRREITRVLTEKINNSFWWHVTPRDSAAYKKRGKFLSSTYRQAEFYGRPNDTPERVRIANPVFGFPEEEILEQLFPGKAAELLKGMGADGNHAPNWYEKRIDLDAKMCRRAREMGFDAIVLLGSTGKKSLLQGRKPGSIELNLLNA